MCAGYYYFLLRRLCCIGPGKRVDEYRSNCSGALHARHYACQTRMSDKHFITFICSVSDGYTFFVNCSVLGGIAKPIIGA